MLSKMIKLAGLGFLIGIGVGNVLAVLTGWPDQLQTPALLEKAGSPCAALLLQTLFSGLLGAVGMGGVVFYEMEHWSLLRIMVTHFAVIAAVNVPVSLFMGWTSSPASVLITLAIMALCYLLIFLIMYVRYRIEVRKLNDINEQRSLKKDAETPGGAK